MQYETKNTQNTQRQTVMSAVLRNHVGNQSNTAYSTVGQTKQSCIAQNHSADTLHKVCC